MKYFLDTEFIEGFPLKGNRGKHFIDLISIAIVTSDDEELYLISSEYNYHQASDWVKENVILPLYLKIVPEIQTKLLSVQNFHHTYGFSKEEIANKVLEFVYTTSGINNPNTIGNWKEIEDLLPIDFYGYFSDYDWVLFCSLFGTMIDLPKGFPMYCRDLKQTLDEKVDYLINSDFFSHFHIEEPQLSFKEKLKLVKEQNPYYPKQTDEHDALSDAKWNKELYKFLQRI